MAAAGLLVSAMGNAHAQAETPVQPAAVPAALSEAPAVANASAKIDVPPSGANDKIVPPAGDTSNDDATTSPGAADDIKAVSHDDAPPANLELGGQTILTLHASAGKLTPQERIDVIEGRLVRILGIPRITPGDVAIYTPQGKAPVIYAVGRKLITVDSQTAKQEKPLLPPDDITAVESSANVPLGVATIWAKRFQQILPLVDYRMPGDPEPIVPPDPPLTITNDQTLIGGQIGDVVWGKDLIMRLRGIQHDTTAAERADVVGDRMQLLLHRVGNDPNTISVEPGEPERIPLVAPLQDPAAGILPITDGEAQTISSTASDTAKSAVTMQILPTAAVKIGSTTLITVTTADAAAASQPTPDALAASWAKNLRHALSPIAPPPAIPEPAVPEPAPAPTSTETAPESGTPSVRMAASISQSSPIVTPDPNITTRVELHEDSDQQSGPADQAAPQPIPVPMSTVGLANDMRIRLHTPLPYKQRRKLFI